MTSLEDKLNELSPEKRQQVEERTQALIAEEMSLRELRDGLNQTQLTLARRLGIKQENVSRIENRDDLLLSTLARYVGALGGKLSIVVEYPGRAPIKVTGIDALEDKGAEAASDAQDDTSTGRKSRQVA